MSMRMRELSERSGLPRTTIHHYIREGLLPPARKTAPNAALYGEDHLERLRLVTRLRAEDGEALSIPEVRRVAELIDAGYDEAAAVRLVLEEIEPTGTGGDGPSPAVAEALARAGLVSTAERDAMSAGDLLVSVACEAVCSDRGVEPSDLAPLADLIREVGNYSTTLNEVGEARRGHDSESGSDDLRAALARLCDALLWRAFRG